ncbi:MAG: bacterioferritin [Pyrinomonadaceae bacterium]|jgi:bacterioferritin|nr:bacterioferritin [Pyrinomonadaceae bacterium]
MAETNLIDALNRALSLELGAVVQYMQHSFLVTGIEREVYRKYFRSQGEESQEHAITLGDKIVALGGVPTVEPAMIRQSTELIEMLRQDLEMEREALTAYMTAWEACGDTELPTRFQLEERIYQEKLHVEELEKLTSERKANVTKERITLKQIG